MTQTKKFPSQCTGHLERRPEFRSVLAGVKHTVINGFGSLKPTLSTCLPPCKQVVAKPKFIAAGELNANQSFVGLYFDSKIVKRLIHPAYGLTDLIVEIGSSLGLWLGLSAIGIFDAAALAFGKLAKWLGKSLGQCGRETRNKRT